MEKDFLDAGSTQIRGRHVAFFAMDTVHARFKEKIGEVLLPGDVFSFRMPESGGDCIIKTEKIICGPGLRRNGEEVQVCKSGILRHKQPNLYWIDSQQRRVRNWTHTTDPRVYLHLSF